MTDNDKDKNTKHAKDDALETSTNAEEESEIENQSAEDNIANDDESIDEPTAAARATPPAGTIAPTSGEQPCSVVAAAARPVVSRRRFAHGLSTIRDGPQ